MQSEFRGCTVFATYMSPPGNAPNAHLQLDDEWTLCRVIYTRPPTFGEETAHRIKAALHIAD